MLFLGEADFTFTVAFAALRESQPHTPMSSDTIWKGITATRYEQVPPKRKKQAKSEVSYKRQNTRKNKRKPNLEKVKSECIKFCLKDAIITLAATVHTISEVHSESVSSHPSSKAVERSHKKLTGGNANLYISLKKMSESSKTDNSTIVEEVSKKSCKTLKNLSKSLKLTKSNKSMLETNNALRETIKKSLKALSKPDSNSKALIKTLKAISDTCRDASEMSLRKELQHLSIHCKKIPTLINKLPEVPSKFAWKYGINALNIPKVLIEDQKVIWFQCPWQKGATDNLMKNFLLKLASITKKGVYVCIGITTHTRYCRKYKLDHLIGKKPETAVLKKYRFLGADDHLVNLILCFGYHHRGICDIHKKIFNQHVTLIFERI